MSDIEREEFEQAVTDRWSNSYSFTRFGDEDYYDEVLEGMWWGWQASRQALEGEPVDVERIADTVRDYLGDIFACTRVWEAWQVGTMTQNDFTPADETELADEIATAVAEIYTHPASADVPEKWRTVMKELADDLESEIEARRSGDLDRRIERDLIVVKEARVLLDEQEQGQ